MKVKVNRNNDELYCVYCKSRIEIGEKYIEDVEDCLGDKIKKAYHLECSEVLEEEDDEDTDVFFN